MGKYQILGDISPVKTTTPLVKKILANSVALNHYNGTVHCNIFLMSNKLVIPS